MSSQPVGYPTFLRLLSKRFDGRYSTEQLQSVLECYTGERAGIKKKLKERNEFKEDYFGAWRFSEKGFDNFRIMVTEGMRRKQKATRLSHALAKRKLWHEKRNKTIWAVRNLIEGYKYRDKAKQEFLKEKSKIKASQILFHYKKRKNQLEIEKRIR